ncbi:MAG: phosphatidate cytidylyltransferase [Bacteroidia bacterium]|nr:phosphatidate cytidylyltransferase [Bacteroidia bacterium]NNF30372.1 phosphatidate cytidylyltransferase [Flavobacteriaceae bacterium]MBT8276448.1 phosphatidate cytidylyltransferase [Bacteroidia bacterium]NNJ81166.1 phosphatidate cytidylyltransferase [Flavobacteriaceae bacterium]NNK53483.1 phosphatidate cytidylyltransferase [Flavobacteriaceae bacterium]
MKELIVRSISGVLYISIVIFSLFTSREWFMGLFFILAGITLNEYLRIINLKSLLAYILLAALFYFLSYEIFDWNALYLFLILCCFVCFYLMKELFRDSDIAMFGPKKYVTTVFYLIGGFVFLTLIPMHKGYFNPEAVVGVFILVWSNDSIAYLVGKNFGKKKLMERVSPKKTIEGFLGGLAGSLIAGFLIFKFFDYYPLWMWIIMALIATIFGTIGDLIESKFKRQAGVKDSGVLMPGHGGLYDRLDSIIYASPFLYAFIEISEYVS